MNRLTGTVLDGQSVRMLSEGFWDVKTQTNVLKRHRQDAVFVMNYCRSLVWVLYKPQD